MTLFGESKRVKQLTAQVSILQNQLIARQGYSESLKILNNTIAQYPEWSVTRDARIYATNDDIFSVISLCAKTAALIPMYVSEVKPETTQKQLKALKSVKANSKPYQVKAIQTKALEDLPEDDPLVSLLENPTNYQSKFAWFELIYTWLRANGNAFVFKDRVAYGVNAGKPAQLHILYPQNVVLRVTQSFPQTVVGFDYVINGQTIISGADISDLIHIKYLNTEFSSGSANFLGLSPLKVFNDRLSRMDSNFDNSVSQLQNGGTPTIIWIKDDGSFVNAQGQALPTVEVLGHYKNEFSGFTKNPNNIGAPFFASNEMGAIQLGTKLADLQSLEIDKWDFKKWCNINGVSDVLFNNGESSTESNVKEMTQRLYTNSVLPDVYRVRDALILGLLSDFADDKTVNVWLDGSWETVQSKGDGKKRLITADISDIPELQENAKDVVTWLKEAWWLSGNDKLAVMNYEASDDPLMNQIIIPSGYQLLSDLEVSDIEPIGDEEL